MHLSAQMDLSTINGYMFPQWLCFVLSPTWKLCGQSQFLHRTVSVHDASAMKFDKKKIRAVSDLLNVTLGVFRNAWAQCVPTSMMELGHGRSAFRPQILRRTASFALWLAVSAAQCWVNVLSPEFCVVMVCLCVCVCVCVIGGRCHKYQFCCNKHFCHNKSSVVTNILLS